MDRLIHLVFIGLFCLSFLTPRAQGYTFPFDKSQFQEVTTLYVNANRFIPGERILFQIENNLSNGRPSFVSKIAYIELVDESHQSILKAKVELDEGSGGGYLYIPSFINTGQYTMLAYTSWMLNYSKSRIAQLGIQIINPFNPIPASFLSDSVSIQFYPEGGAYVFNREMKVAYRLSWKTRPTLLNIKLVTSSGEEVSSFVHRNSSPYGHFNFTPKHAEIYKVIISDQNENIHYDELLVENNSSFGIRVIENEDNLQVTAINQSGSVKELKLILWNPQNYQESFSISSDSTFSINTSGLPDGLAYLYYEDTAIGRFVSISGSGFVHFPILQKSKDQYSTREPVNLQSIFNENLTTFLVSVRKVDDPVFKNSYSSSLWHQLLNQNLETAELRSDFLICNGIPLLETQPESISTLPDYRGQLLKGQLGDYTPANKGDIVFLSSVGQNPMVRTAKVQEDGQFLLLSPDSYKGESLIAFSRGKKSIFLVESFLTDYSFIRGDFHFDRTDLLPWLQKKAIHVQIENNYFEFKRDSLLDPIPVNWFAKRIDKSYDFDEYTRFPTITDVVVEIVPELRLRERNGRLEMIMPYIESQSSSVDSTLILVDGVPIVAAEFVKLNPLQLKKVDLIFQQLRIGFVEYRGVAIFTSLGKDAAMLTGRTGYSQVSLLPIQDKVKYYQPNYKDDTSRIPDYRSQLFWQSYSGDSKENAIKFYTSDLTGKFEVVVQGKDKKGNYVFSKNYFEVSK